MKQIQIGDIDFDSIKQNIKSFLQNQSQFDAYDFDGSAMNILLDILSANTHYNLLYTNMAINEGFIDSASKRESVVSLAKSLGYTAKSARGAVSKSTITVTLPALEEPAFLTMPKGSLFATVVGDYSYTFSTLTDYTAPRLSGVYEFTDVLMTEGTPAVKTFVVGDGTQFVIPNLNVDTTTISVDVSPSVGSSSVTKFVAVEDILTTKGTDKVFFLKQRDDLFFEVFFGNDSIGASVANGNVVRVKYLLTEGAAANGASTFTYQSGWRADIGVELVTTQVAYNGSAEEEIESIRFNAPRMWISQNRALTTADYENVLLSTYPTIESIHAWGGQDNVPKTYGKVFICAKPYNADAFSVLEKQNMIEGLLLRRGVVSVAPEFVDASFMNIEIAANVYYNAVTSRKTAGELETLARSTISSYGATLNKFDSVFRYSKLSALIDGIDSSVSSNSMNVRIRVPETPYYGLGHTYTRTLNNPITSNPSGGNLYTTRFYIGEFTDRCYVKDDGAGLLWLITEDAQGTPTTQYEVGTIDYTTCSWNITSLNITTLHDPLLEFVVIPSSNDVVSNRNIIVTVNSALTTVSAVSDTIAAGSAVGGANYRFTTVR